MTFDPERFLELSKELIDDPNYDGEGVSRTVVGRAYYAAFLIVKRRLEESGKRFPKKKSHQRVINALKRRDHALGDKLFQLLRLREDADYVMGGRVNEKTAKNSIRLSEYIVGRSSVII